MVSKLSSKVDNLSFHFCILAALSHSFKVGIDSAVKLQASTSRADLVGRFSLDVAPQLCSTRSACCSRFFGELDLLLAAFIARSLYSRLSSSITIDFKAIVLAARAVTLQKLLPLSFGRGGAGEGGCYGGIANATGTALISPQWCDRLHIHLRWQI